MATAFTITIDTKKNLGNPEFAEAMRLKARSSAASQHKNRGNKRNRTRANQRRRAIQDQY